MHAVDSKIGQTCTLSHIFAYLIRSDNVYAWRQQEAWHQNQNIITHWKLNFSTRIWTLFNWVFCSLQKRHWYSFRNKQWQPMNFISIINFIIRLRLMIYQSLAFNSQNGRANQKNWITSHFYVIPNWSNYQPQIQAHLSLVRCT